jgi:hypothetical protein
VKKMTEFEYKEMIYKKAGEVRSQKDLAKLLKEVLDYQHDYGTIVYGCMAAMKAAFSVVNRSPQGGITGFQASCLGWECIQEFMSVKPPCRILDYNNLLYPQYASKFEKVISQDAWNDLRKKAEEKLKDKNELVHPSVVKHWQSIAAGQLPFGFRVGDQA